MNIETIKALCPEFEYIERTLNRQGPKCQDFYEGHIRDLKTHVLNLGKALAEARQALEWRPISEYDGESLAVFCLQVINTGNEQKQWDVLVGMPDASGQVVAVDGDDLGWGLEDVEFFKYVTFPIPPSGKEG